MRNHRAPKLVASAKEYVIIESSEADEADIRHHTTSLFDLA